MKPFVEKLKLMKVTLAVLEKGIEAEALLGHGQVPVFGLLKRGGKVYTQIIQDAKGSTLIPIIQKKVIPDSIVYSDCWRGYNTLDVTDFNTIALTIQNCLQIREIILMVLENFWNQAKPDMRKFNGIPKESFWLFLKECEWRFNTQNPKIQLTQIRQWVRPYLT